MWREKQIGDIANVIPSNVDKKSVPGQRKIKLCNYMDVYNNRYIHGELDFMIATAKADQIEKYKLLPDDVIITKDSETPEDIAVPAVVGENIDDLICGYHLAILRPKEFVNGKFLMYRLCEDAVRRQFFRVANGSTRYGLTIGAIENVNLDFPEEPEQNSIVETLEATEEAIAATRGMLDKQDKIKDGLLQDLLTRGVDQNGKLRPHPEDAPDLYKSSPLGLIPKDWDVVELGDSSIKIIDGDRGSHYPNASELLDDGHCVFLNASNVTKNGFKFKTVDFITAEKDSKLRKGKLVRNDIVLTTRGTVGNFAYYSDDIAYEDMRINSGMVILRNEEKDLDTQFFYYSFGSFIFTAENQRSGSGSAQPQLPIKDLVKFNFLKPSPDEQELINKKINEFMNNYRIVENEFTKLKKLKSGLMQDLLTGKKRIPVKQKEAA